MRFAYADPPYIGCARMYPEKQEVDHEALILRLVDEYPDGWALSCHSPSLKTLLPLCPDDVRVMVWVKPFAFFKPGVGVAYSWEPILVRGGRKRKRNETNARDWVKASIIQKGGVLGSKPREFCFWLFDVWNAREGDELHDLYPGSGAVTRSWQEYLSQRRLPLWDCRSIRGDRRLLDL